MLSVILAFTGSLIYGASDFFGGIGARRWNSVAVTFASSSVGLIFILVCLLFVPGTWSAGVLLWGILAGLAGVSSLILLYACLAIGPMSILAPIMGLISATLPVVVGLATGEHLGSTGIAGLIVGLIAIVLICLVPDSKAVRASLRGILLAVGAGLCVGLYLVFIDQSPSNSGLAPLTIVFLVSVVATGGVLVSRHLIRRLTPTPAEPPRPETLDPDPAPRMPPLLAAALAGVTDAPATIMFLVALRLGDLAIVSVLSALAPAGTVVLAAVLLRERIALLQWLGLAAALAAAALLSIP